MFSQHLLFLLGQQFRSSWVVKAVTAETNHIVLVNPINRTLVYFSIAQTPALDCSRRPKHLCDGLYTITLFLYTVFLSMGSANTGNSLDFCHLWAPRMRLRSGLRWENPLSHREPLWLSSPRKESLQRNAMLLRRWPNLDQALQCTMLLSCLAFKMIKGRVAGSLSWSIIHSLLIYALTSSSFTVEWTELWKP